MRIRKLLLMSVFVGAAVLIGTDGADAQPRYERGQNVAPVFEGWERNADGTYNMVFGYMNRNYQEEPHIAVGASNYFGPGPQDQGQPTHFYPRRQQFVFNVKVPADWGKKELAWTLTHNGRTDRAYGSLKPDWMLDSGVIKANRGMGLTGADYKNQAPSIRAIGQMTTEVTLPNTLSITVVSSDDGLPGPRPPRVRQPEARSRPRPIPASSPNSQAVVNASFAATTGLGVTWIHYRGLGKVTFDPMAISISGGNGEAVTTVSFSEAGTYILRAYADDGILTTPVDVTVTVKSRPDQ
jgi:hypothetical protein